LSTEGELMIKRYIAHCLHIGRTERTLMLCHFVNLDKSIRCEEFSDMHKIMHFMRI